jgi:hypothetical protein
MNGIWIKSQEGGPSTQQILVVSNIWANKNMVYGSVTVDSPDSLILGEYATPERAEQVYAALWKAIMNNKTYFEMPKE